MNNFKFKLLISKLFSSSKKFISFQNCVLVSKSRNIFENLAIEDWLYRNISFENNKILLLWFNKPCIVIGRHQNPWQELNLNNCLKNNILIARRNSGGGTVYHDLNNLNICFFTDKKLYNRKSNLEFLKNIIKQDFNIDLEINCKEDLIFLNTNEKVSGTASKLAFNKSYHHCTLLVDSNLNDLRFFLKKNSENIITNATKSVPSTVKNLSSVNNEIKIENVLKSIYNNYLSLNNFEKVHFVDFDEKYFYKIKDLKLQLENWDWVFGKTPKFKITNKEKINNDEFLCEIEVIKGLIDNISLYKNNEKIIDNNLSSLVCNQKVILNNIENILVEWLKTKNCFESLFLKNLIYNTIKLIY